ncbi:MAG: hypothetical protein P4L33_11845 [Capsulimonadaceae bacterium]|nr:hypothetical protein [Capsulimonadaceae bacterium]
MSIELLADADPCRKDLWHDDAAGARRAMTQWWAGKGLAVAIIAPKEVRSAEFPHPGPPPDLQTQWLDPVWRAKSQLHNIANTYWGGAALPQFNSLIGPGSLGLFLGGIGRLAPDTIWYEGNIDDPETSPPLAIKYDGDWWTRHVAILREAKRHAKGRYIVPFPDLIENIDTLAQLRDPQTLLMDLIERPEWVSEKVSEINAAFFAAYDELLEQCDLLDEWGGTSYCFSLWGKGKTVKVQCDFSCMISPSMYRQFVVPALTEQCAWLDNSMYHLDGEQAIPQLDNILAIEPLKAVEWTPAAGRPGGGSPIWYDLYRRIKQGGKSVQAIGVGISEVEPLIDAVGPEGLMIITYASSEADARALLERLPPIGG